MRYSVEVEIGIAYGEPGGQWNTMLIHQRAHEHLSQEEIEHLAISEARRRLDANEDARATNWIAHMWVHSYNDDPDAFQEDDE